MGQTLNSVRAVGQIRTSPLLLLFGLENGLVRFLCSHESCRPMSHQVCVRKIEVIRTSRTRDMTQIPNNVPVWTTPTSLF